MPWTDTPTCTRWGWCAYYLLTGHLVFEGETAIQTILLHVQGEPVPPSQRTENPVPPRWSAGARLPGEESRRAAGSAAELGAELASIDGRAGAP